MDKILLFIPVYNCEKQIQRVLSQLNINVLKYISEVIVINNQSIDNSEAVAIDYCRNNKQLPVKILRNKENYGLGGSHKAAFKYAVENNFDYIIVLHGDDQGDISDIIPYLDNKEYQKYDCLLGARFMKGSQLKGYSKFRTFGNYVYDFIFSIGTGFNVYDLGSGLNMYNVHKILTDNFYEKFKDNLMFNYCMIMGSSYYNHKIKFFPISWREDDQISNVKLANQAIVVLKMLTSFLINKERFILDEHRDKIFYDYSFELVYSNI